MIRVMLNTSQVLISGTVGIERAKSYKAQYEGKTQKINYNQHRKGEDFRIFAKRQIDGVGGECAVAAYLGFIDYVPENGTYKDKADVGDNIEVKHTYYDNGGLIINVADRNEDIAVLVQGRCPTYFIAGWMYVKDCKNDRYRDTRIGGDSYLVQWQELRPMATLAMIGSKAYELVSVDE
jgi:hypothetical protein